MPDHMNGGWPHELDDDPPELPPLQDRPTYRELAEAVGSALIADRQWRPKATQAFRYLRDGLQQLRTDMNERFERIETMLAGKLPRPRLPSLTQYDPDLTPAGGIRIDSKAWEAIQERLGAEEMARKGLEARLSKADAEAAGYERALDHLKKRILFWIAILVPASGLVGWLLTHFAHL